MTVSSRPISNEEFYTQYKALSEAQKIRLNQDAFCGRFFKAFNDMVATEALVGALNHVSFDQIVSMSGPDKETLLRGMRPAEFHRIQNLLVVSNRPLKPDAIFHSSSALSVLNFKIGSSVNHVFSNRLTTTAWAERKVEASGNQYGVGGFSICTCAAIAFALEVRKNQNVLPSCAEDLDKILLAGKALYQRCSASAEAHLEPEEVLQVVYNDPDLLAFPVVALDSTSDQAVKNRLKEELIKDSYLCDKGHSSSWIITGLGASYAAIYNEKTKQVAFFDSHGEGNAKPGTAPKAFMEVFSSVEKFIEYISTLIPPQEAGFMPVFMSFVPVPQKMP